MAFPTLRSGSGDFLLCLTTEIRSTLRSQIFVFVLVQKSRDLPSQLGRSQQLTHRSSSVKELPLELRRDGVPLHDDRRAKTSKDMLLFSGEGVVGRLPFIRAFERLVEIVRQPLFVVSKRAEAVTRVLIFANLAWVVRLFAERVVFGCLRAILLCGEHFEAPFFAIRDRSAI